MPDERSSPYAPTDARVRVFTLGRFRVEVDGAPLRFESRGQRKPLELLKVLIALGGENVPADRLTESLWPDADGDTAQQSLATTLHRLRRLIGSEALILRNRALSLEPGLCWVDARAFENAVRHACTATPGAGAAWDSLDEALALYRGPFLDGEFEPPEILSARERLHGFYLRQVRNAAEALCAHGGHERAIALYRRGLEADELAEDFHQGLMRCYLAQGRFAEGVAAYRRCREVLAATVNVEPSAGTEELYHEVLNAQVADAPGPATEAPGVAAASASGRSRPRRRGAIMLAAGVAGLALVVALLTTLVWLASRGPSPVGDAAAPLLPLPDRPSIAVLPFENLSDDPEQAYFSEGISDDIIGRLARVSGLLVIARHASFAYKGRTVSVKQVGRELGVRHVLTGSVRRDGERVRVSVQLVDAQNGSTRWAQHYDRVLTGLFSVQDEITKRIAETLQVQFALGDLYRIRRQGTRNPAAWEEYLRGVHEQERASQTAATFLLARMFYQSALRLDSDYDAARLGLGWSYLDEGIHRESGVPGSGDPLERATELARQVLERNPDSAEAHALVGQIHLHRRNYERAAEAGRRAVALNPNGADWYAHLANTLLYAGRTAAALEAMERARRLSPFSPPWYEARRGHALYLAGRFEEAAAVLGRYIAQADAGPKPENWRNRGVYRALPFRVMLIAVHGALGRPEAVGSHVAAIRAQSPNFRVDAYVERYFPYRDESARARLVADAARGGL